MHEHKGLHKRSSMVTVHGSLLYLQLLLFYSILFYSILFYSIPFILFYSIPFILFYSILFHSISVYSIPFILFYSILFHLFYSIPFHLFYSIPFHLFYSILFYSILFILFYSIPFYAIPFILFYFIYSILFHSIYSILFHSIPFILFYSILFYSILCSNQSILESEDPKTGMNGLKKREKCLLLPGIKSQSPCSSSPQAYHYTDYGLLVPYNLILTEINHESKREWLTVLRTAWGQVCRYCLAHSSSGCWWSHVEWHPCSDPTLGQVNE